jgi:ABC-type bacteriocin/lantibiotic exporter with double-glycine peptidase domain
MIGKILLVAMTGTLMAQSQSDNGFRILYQTPSAPSSSCAVDSLYVSLKKIGMDCSLESLEENIPANPRGATLEAVVECAKKSGVSPTVIRSDMRSLLEVRMPAILHVNGDHFVTVLAVKDDDLFIFDNSIGLAGQSHQTVRPIIRLTD